MKIDYFFFSILCASVVCSSVKAQQVPVILFKSGPTLTLAAGAAPSAIAVGDFNQDNRSDIAVCERGLGQVVTYLQTSAGTFPTPNATFPVGQAPSGLVCVSTNPNQYSADLVALSGPSSKWTVLRNNNNGSGSFTPVTPFYAFGTGTVSVNPQLISADVNHDFYPDFVYTYDGNNDTFIQWSTYLGQNSMTGGYVYETNFVPSSVGLDDFDRDGHPDIVIIDPTHNNLLVVLAEPASGPPLWYQANTNFIPSGGLQPVHVATGDLTGDLLPDIALAQAGSKEVTVFLNLTHGKFGSQYSYKLTAAPRKVALADLNGDRFPELLVITADNQLQVFLHSGAATSTAYTLSQTLATGVDPTTLQVVDLDGDTYKDIVVGCIGDNTIRTYLNRTFATITATQAKHFAGVEVFPTVAANELTVRYKGAYYSPLKITLLDQLGRTIREAEMHQASTTIAVADLPRGLYLVRLLSAAGSRTTRVMLQ